jgi:hypothetical protein
MNERVCAGWAKRCEFIRSRHAREGGRSLLTMSFDIRWNQREIFCFGILHPSEKDWGDAIHLGNTKNATSRSCLDEELYEYNRSIPPQTVSDRRSRYTISNPMSFLKGKCSAAFEDSALWSSVCHFCGKKFIKLKFLALNVKPNFIS